MLNMLDELRKLEGIEMALGDVFKRYSEFSRSDPDASELFCPLRLGFSIAPPDAACAAGL